MPTGSSVITTTHQETIIGNRNRIIKRNDKGKKYITMRQYLKEDNMTTLTLVCLLLLISDATKGGAHSSTKTTRVVTTKSSTSTSPNIALIGDGNSTIVPVGSVARSAERKLSQINNRISQLEERILEDHHGRTNDDDVEVDGGSSTGQYTHQQLTSLQDQGNSSGDSSSDQSSSDSNQQEFNYSNNNDLDRKDPTIMSTNDSDGDSSSNQKQSTNDQDQQPDMLAPKDSSNNNNNNSNNNNSNSNYNNNNNATNDQLMTTDNKDKEDPSQSAASFIQPDWSLQLDPNYFAELNAKNHDSRQQQLGYSTTTPTTTSSNSYPDFTAVSSAPAILSSSALSTSSLDNSNNSRQQNKNNRFNRNNMSIISSDSDLIKSYSSVQLLNRPPSTGGNGGSTSYYSPNYGKSTRRSSLASGSSTQKSHPSSSSVRSSLSASGINSGGGQPNEGATSVITTSATTNLESKMSHVSPPRPQIDNQEDQAAADGFGDRQSVIHRSTTNSGSNLMSRYSQPMSTASSEAYNDHIDSDSVTIRSNTLDDSKSNSASTLHTNNRNTASSIMSNGHLNGYNSNTNNFNDNSLYDQRVSSGSGGLQQRHKHHYQDITTQVHSLPKTSSSSQPKSSSLSQRSSLYDDYNHLSVGSGSGSGSGNIDNNGARSLLHNNDNGNNNNDSTYKHSLANGYISGIDDENKLSSSGGLNGDDGSLSQQSSNNNRNNLMPISQPFTVPTYATSSGLMSNSNVKSGYYSTHPVQQQNSPVIDYSSGSDPTQMTMHHRTTSEQQMYGQPQNYQQQSTPLSAEDLSPRIRSSSSNSRNGDNVYSDELYNGYASGAGSNDNQANSNSLEMGNTVDNKYYYSLNSANDQNIATMDNNNNNLGSISGASSSSNNINNAPMDASARQSTTGSTLSNQMIPPGSGIYYASSATNEPYNSGLPGQEESLLARHRSSFSSSPGAVNVAYGHQQQQQQQYLDLIQQAQANQMELQQLNNNRQQQNSNNIYVDNDLLDSSGATSATGYTSPTASASNQQQHLQQQQQYGQQTPSLIMPSNSIYSSYYSPATSPIANPRSIQDQDQSLSSATAAATAAMQTYNNFYTNDNNNNNNYNQQDGLDQRVQSNSQVPFRRSYINPNLFRLEASTPSNRYYYTAPTSLSASYLSPAAIQALAIAQTGSHQPAAIYATSYGPTQPQVAIAPGDYASAALGPATSQYLDPEPAESTLAAMSLDHGLYGTGQQQQQLQQAASSSSNDNQANQASGSGTRGNLASWSNIGTLLLGSLPFGMLIAALWPVMSGVGRKKRELVHTKDLAELLKFKSPSKILSALIQEASGPHKPSDGAAVNDNNDQYNYRGKRKRYLKTSSSPSLFRIPFRRLHHTNNSGSHNNNATSVCQTGHNNRTSSMCEPVMKDIINSLDSDKQSTLTNTQIKDNSIAGLSFSHEKQKLINQDRPKTLKLINGSGTGDAGDTTNSQNEMNNTVTKGIKTKAKKALGALNYLLTAANKLKRKHRSSHGNAAWNILSSPFVNFNHHHQSKFRSAVDQTIGLFGSKLNGSQLLNHTNSILLALARHLNSRQHLHNLSNLSLGQAVKMGPLMRDINDLETSSSSSNLRMFDDSMISNLTNEHESNHSASLGTTRGPRPITRSPSPNVSEKYPIETKKKASVVGMSESITSKPTMDIINSNNSTQLMSTSDGDFDEQTRSRLDTCLNQFFCRLVVKLNIKGNESIQDLKRAHNQANSLINQNQQVKTIKLKQERLAKRYIRELMSRISSKYPYTIKEYGKSNQIDDIFKAASEEQCLSTYSCGELVQLEQILTRMNLTITR